jgi:hypothetical protein
MRIFIDEFEKMFEKPSYQSGLLSVIDGTSSKKNLFLFTANEKGMINKFFFNRPGRIRYAYEYDTLPDSVVLEVLEDILDNKGKVKEIASIISYLKEPSFDVVCSIAQEANLYPDFTIQQLMDGYNSEIYSESLMHSDCTLLINGQDFYSVFKELFSKYGLNLQDCNPSYIASESAIELKEQSLNPYEPKTSVNIMDYSMRAFCDGAKRSYIICIYLDISKMELEVKDRTSIISNVRISEEEIGSTAETILHLMQTLNKEVPDSAKEEVYNILSSNDVKLVSKPAQKLKINTFGRF